jgi:hypothetical protein
MERKVSYLEAVHFAQLFHRDYLKPAVGLLLVHRYFMGELTHFVLSGAKGE